MAGINAFVESTDRFKSKYEAFHEIQQVEDGNYASLQELEEANKKLEELDEKYAKLEKEIQDKSNKTIDDIKRLEDIQTIRGKNGRLSEAKASIDEKIKIATVKEELEETDPEINVKRQELERRQKELEAFKAQHNINNQTKAQIDASLSQGAGGFDKLSDTLSGKVTTQDIATAAAQIDNGYDQAVSDLSTIITGNSSTNYLASWARVQFGDELYDVASAVKNGASGAIEGIDEFMSLGDIFGGSWRDPMTSAKKIETGLKTIQSGVNKVNKLTNDILSALNANENSALGKFGTLTSKVGNLNNMGIATAGALAGSVAMGIGSFNAFKEGNIGAGISGIRDSISSVKDAYADFQTRDLANKAEELEALKQEKALEMLSRGKAPGDIDEDNKSENESIKPADEEDDATSKSQGYSSSSLSGTAGREDFSADMIHEINIILDGVSSSQNSYCTINGEKYKLSGYSISQELLQPVILNFSIEKDDKTETQRDVVFADATSLIGKSFEMQVSTVKVSQEEGGAVPREAFQFKGMIIDVSASRAMASTQSASVHVATWDALLQNAPRCRSFENMTLKEIVDTVLKPYRDIKSNISPRFKKKIPYIVQYDQSDYAFISMLAIRFGEWMYNTGDTFVFGELDVEDSSSANLEYPGGSLMSYSLHQNMAPFSFSHLLPDYYQYGKEKSIQKASAQGMVEGKANDWTDKAYNASIQRFQDEQTMTLKAGGFDSGKESEGADDILDYSLKIEAQGKLTAIMTVQGFSKLAMLKIGQTFLIRDNVQNKSGESKDVEQKSLKVIGINHSFDYRQEYSNSFMAIPVACNYPSYSDADMFAPAPQQRAKVVDNKDEQKLGRVRVQFPWQEILSKDMKTPWLRIAVPYAGQNKGQHFVPEIGEEVMVGFEMNNAERPYVIGSFYNAGTGKPDEAWAVSQEKDGTSNNIKAIRTRNGHTLLFNDKGEAGLLEIYDNKNNAYHITLSADDKKITIYSAGEIEVVADTDINITAKGDIGISADGDVGIKSKGSISIDANRDISIQASRVKVR